MFCFSFNILRAFFLAFAMGIGNLRTGPALSISLSTFKISALKPNSYDGPRSSLPSNPPVPATTPRRQPPSDPRNTIIIFFFVILFLLFFFLLPLLSHAPKIIKPIPVKSNWISFIVFLFLFAIIAGVLAQSNDAPSTPNVTNRVNNRASESNRNRNQEVQVNGDLRRRNRSSSNPDLRQKPLPENGDNNHSRLREGREENIHHRTRRSEARKVNSRLEESIEVVPDVPGIMVQRCQSPIRVRPPLSPPAPAPTVSGESRRLDQTVQVTNQIIRLHEGSHIPPPPPANREAREDKKEIDGGDSFGPSPISSTPSCPDVNVKADLFISRLKDKWRTEY